MFFDHYTMDTEHCTLNSVLQHCTLHCAHYKVHTVDTVHNTQCYGHPTHFTQPCEPFTQNPALLLQTADSSMVSVSTRATAGRLERSHAVVQTGEKREERHSGAHILHWDIGNCEDCKTSGRASILHWDNSDSIMASVSTRATAGRLERSHAVVQTGDTTLLSDHPHSRSASTGPEEPIKMKKQPNAERVDQL